MMNSMADNAENVVVTNNPDLLRYEARLGDELAGFAAYRLEEGRITFTHTEVGEAFGGKGVGSSLARGALDDVRATGVFEQCGRDFTGVCARFFPEHILPAEQNLRTFRGIARRTCARRSGTTR